MAELLKGASVVAALTEELAGRVDVLAEHGVVPTLATLRVGEREDDLSYERGARKRCEAAGIAVRSYTLSEDCSQEELLSTIAEINTDDAIHGCLMFRPLPAGLNEAAACTMLDPAKDIDCATEASLIGVLAGRATGFPPCTAEACVRLLDHYNIELEGKRVVVVGRSLVIGKPVAMMLLARNATVTICHTRTHNLAAECSRADILIAAAGHAGTITEACLAPGQVVVDVGINWDEAAQKLVGDVDFDAAQHIVAATTPVPGGIGPITTAILAKHVVEAAERSVA